MRKISVCSTKGGVGKTAVSVNLATELALASKTTLLVDLAPQADATCHLGVANEHLELSSYHLLTDKTDDIAQCVSATPIRNLSIIPADRAAMPAVDLELAQLMGREAVLSEKMSRIGDTYDFIIYDCPTGAGLTTINALMASDEWIVPVQAHYLALNGLDQLFGTALALKERLECHARLTGLVCTLFDSRTRLSREIAHELSRIFGDLMYNTVINYHTSVGEAPTFGMPVGVYEPGKDAHREFQAFAAETLSRGTSRVNRESFRQAGAEPEPDSDESSTEQVTAIRRQGDHLRGELNAIMESEDLLSQSPQFKTLSDPKVILEYRAQKRRSLSKQEADELWS